MSQPDELPDTRSGKVTRRVVLRGATVGGVAFPLLAACAGSDAGTGDVATDAPSTQAPKPEGGSSGGGGGLATSDVPVGGGTVLKEQKVVVTQPTKGDFKAFTAVCTHQGCVVKEVAGGEIVCGCHGSHFSIEDGSPVAGPAQAPLEAADVSVEGDRISIG